MQSTHTHPLLPIDHLEHVEGWGGAVGSAGYVFRPSTVEQLGEVFAIAKRTGRKVTLRGSGRSYGDASIGAENIVLDLTRMNRIIEWDPMSGRIVCEPGVTIRQLWQYTVQDGWWPNVVPGTMFPTLGGCLGMNIHGKNNFVAGPIGDHVESFEFLTPEGDSIFASPTENSEFFYAAIGSFGMLGCFTKITLRLKRVYSGLLEVESIVAKDLSELIKLFYERVPESDYLVGWIDAFATGAKLGRAQIHQANYLEQGADPNPAQTLRIENQELPDTIFGLIPKSIVWRFLKPFVNDLGFRMINRAKYLSAAVAPKGKKFRQSHAGFAFLLDYVPNWKKSYGTGGLIQYQSFIPKETAESCFRAQLTLCQQEKLVPYLAVFKRHKPDNFLMTHAVDGFSLALDFKITPKNRQRVWALAQRLNQIVLDSGGRFYLAKDATLSAEAFKGYLTDEVITRFRDLKRKCDPNNILETDLSRRLLR
jgi:decaprenylphospho-beta-D-ribofuranose 2-oxidase